MRPITQRQNIRYLLTYTKQPPELIHKEAVCLNTDHWVKGCKTILKEYQKEDYSKLSILFCCFHRSHNQASDYFDLEFVFNMDLSSENC